MLECIRTIASEKHANKEKGKERKHHKNESRNAARQ